MTRRPRAAPRPARGESTAAPSTTLRGTQARRRAAMAAQARAAAALRGARATETADASARTRELAFTSYLRVGAMAAVVLIHTLSAIVGNEALRGSAGWWLAVSLDLGSSWAVPLFVMVSGALLLEPAPGTSVRDFYARRVHRIAIPLVVAHVGYVVLRAAGGEDLTAAGLVQDVLRGTVYTHLYFFWIVLGLYVVTPLLWVVVADRRRAAVIGGAALAWMWLVSAASAGLHLTGAPVEQWQPAILTLWIPYLGYFILGHALRGVRVGRRGILLAGVLFFLADGVAAWHYGWGRSLPVAELLFGGGYQGLPIGVATISLFVIGAGLLHPASPAASPGAASAARRLGGLTLGVFVVHMAVLVAIRAVLPGMAFGLVATSVPLALVQWGLTLLTSFAACAAIARVPVVRRAIGL